MSLLNSEAISLILNQPDILSEQGKIQEIWESFVKDTNGAEDDKLLKVIVNSTDANVIKYLLFGEEDCMTRINKFHNMVKDVKELGVTENALTNFLYAMDESLSDYVSIKDNSRANIKINMDKNFDNPSYRDESVILTAMVKNGLINSAEVQSLLDNQYLDLVTATNRCISICSGGESPLNEKGSGIQTPSELTMNDFGVPVDKILSCVKSLITSDVDLFPNSPLDMKQMIFPADNFDTGTLFRQGVCMNNLANYDILSVTAKYIEDSFQLDKDTAVYQLSVLMDWLKESMYKFNQSICLLSYMIAGSMIIRYLKTGQSEESSSDVTSAVYALKQNIANAYSLFTKIDEVSPSKISDMVRIPEELEDFIKMTGYELSDDDIYSDMTAALNDILSGIEEIGATLEEGYGISVISDSFNKKSLGDSDALSSLTESSGIEQASDTCIQKYVKSVTEAASKFHSELNRSLLERNFEHAANQIALECALLEQIDNRLVNSFEVTTVTESLKRDILTYKEKINSSSTGIMTYQKTAEAYVASLLG